MRFAVVAVVLLLVASPAVGSEPGPRILTFEERVAAQKAIEQVYWNHRIWPRENPQPKPPLSAVITDETIGARVEDYLKKSNALDQWWHRPITAVQLQAEMDRMAKSSRDPGILRELFAALGGDPLLIAETLARQTLVDRLIHSWYSNDARVHGELKKRAKASLDVCKNVSCMRSMGGEYRETTWKRDDHSPDLRSDDRRDHQVVLLDAEAWSDRVHQLSTQFGNSLEAPSTRKLGRLEETATSFSVSALLAKGQDEITTANVVWRKQPFDAWWGTTSSNLGTKLATGVFRYSPTEPAADRCTVDTWTRTPSWLDPREFHTAVWTGTEMIVWGGNGGVVYDDGSRYNPSTDSWVPTSTGVNVPVARYAHSAVWTGTEMIVWGGVGGPDHRNLNSGGRYNPSTDSWATTSMGSDVPAPRIHQTAVWTGNEMIVWGGDNYPFRLNTGGRYNPSTDSWTRTSTGVNVPAARNYHTAVWTGNEMIVFGGIGTREFNDGGRYNPSTDSWTVSTFANVPTPRFGHTAVWTGTEMIIWGGFSVSVFPNRYWDTGGRYDPSTDSWVATSTGANDPGGRYLHSAVWTGTAMIVWGGRNGYPSPFVLNTGGRYDPSTDSWATTSSSGVPDARDSHSAVWTGSEMIVWGGNTNSIPVVVDTGGRYSPTTNSWVATSSGASMPVPRIENTAVWTGTEMIVWGGSGDNTGERYNPSIDSWTPTSTGESVPAARFRHTAVWTGVEMIVWGGFGEQPWLSYLNSGGRYNPSSDSWAATSTGANVPAPRAGHSALGHSAVWIGTEMIVWGGLGGPSDNYQLFNTGGRYNPSTDSWLTTSTGSNVPDGRESHSAVWTGSEMIIWGGYNQLNYGQDLNSGGRYNPSTDSWSVTSTGTNVPSPRTENSVVWTGTEMIVWGGSDNTGGRYTPSTDSWTATSIGANVPVARSHHTAVWTGSDMIIWGGKTVSANDAYLNSGAAYDPSSDSWVTTSTGPNVPYGRWFHTAVWTGTEMIVSGGGLSSGGRYCGPNACFGYNGPVDCDDNNPCTDDSCDPTSGCAHTDNSSSCDDGNACTSEDTCGGGICIPGGATACDDGDPCNGVETCNLATGCVRGNPVTCAPPDQCHIVGTCDPSSGLCGYAAKPDGTTCDDGNPSTTGDDCMGGVCAGNGCHSTNDPKSKGWYHSLCTSGGHSGDSITDVDAACVASKTTTFHSLTTAAQVCAVLDPSGNGNDACVRDDDSFMALALNICKQRVCETNTIDSNCGSNMTVGQSLHQADALFSSLGRTAAQCDQGQCLSQEIDTGHALELDTLTTLRDSGNVRLNWLVPVTENGLGHPESYKVYRRPAGSLAPFVQIGSTTGTTYLDLTAGTTSWEYDVQPVF